MDAIVQQLTDGGADYSFECVGNTKTDAPGTGMHPQGLGPQSMIIGVARGRRRNQHPPLPARHRPANGKGSAFGGARGRTDVPKIVDWYMDGKIAIDELITHRLKLDDINEGFALMKRGESIRSVVVY